jgi:hypothetical protein
MVSSKGINSNPIFSLIFCEEYRVTLKAVFKLALERGSLFLRAVQIAGQVGKPHPLHRLAP